MGWCFGERRKGEDGDCRFLEILKLKVAKLDAECLCSKVSESKFRSGRCWWRKELNPGQMMWYNYRDW